MNNKFLYPVMFNVIVLLLILFVPQITWLLAYLYCSLAILILFLCGIGTGLIQGFVNDNETFTTEYRNTFAKAVEKVENTTIPMFLFAFIPVMLIVYQFYLAGFIVIATTIGVVSFYNLVTNITFKLCMK